MTIAIGALSKASGVKVPTIRFYEGIGLLPRPPRTASNRRIYGPEDVRRLRFIRHARELGFEIDSIQALLAMTAEPQASCDRADSIARRHLTEVDRRIASLTALRGELQRMVDECSGGRVSECRVIEVLDDHDRCQHDHGSI
jgi:DNA-binding transcriptional MerR regulator